MCAGYATGLEGSLGPSGVRQVQAFAQQREPGKVLKRYAGVEEFGSAALLQEGL